MRHWPQRWLRRLSAVAMAIPVAIMLAGTPVTPAAAQKASGNEAQRARAALLPTSEKVSLLRYDRLLPKQQGIERAIYDDTRTRMIAANIDPVFASDVLAVLTDGADDRFPARARLAADPLHHPRPTLAKLLCDREALDAIGASIEKQHVRRLQPRRQPSLKPVDPEAEVVIDLPIDPAVFVARASRDMFNRAQLPTDRRYRCPHNGASHTIPGVPRWTVPVRIAATGFPESDAMISEVLADIRRHVPHVPVDAYSFPAPASAANMFFTPSGGQDVLISCFYEFVCSSLHNIVSESPAPAPSSARDEFLSRTYLTLPYFYFAAADAALVEVSPAGNIVGALCSVSVRSNAVSRSQLTSCLTQALGAFPVDHPVEYDPRTPESTAEFDAVALSTFPQLSVLYR